MMARFHTFMLISVVLLQLLASRYISLNDLAVYGAALENGIYEGDFAFELLQTGIAAVLGGEFVILCMQLTLLIIVVIYIYKIRMKVNSNIYIAAFLIFTSPMVLVGLTNSIRQSFAFILLILAFELRTFLLQFGLISIAILMHKASLVLLPLLIAMIVVHAKQTISLKRAYLFWILGALFGAFAASVWYINDIIEQVSLIYDRYSVYLYSAEVFTEGRVGATKLMAWTIFWVAVLQMSVYFNSGLRKSIYLIVPLLFSLLVTTDATIRGFDEFHSRLLMFNNVFVVVWLVNSVKNQKNKNFTYFIVFLFNLFNPATIGVLIK